MRLRTSRHELKTITKVGIFSAICMALAVAIVVKLGNLYFGSTSGYSAMLADATGLSKGDPVKIAGIRSGTVNSIKLEHGAARVGFSLDKSVQMRATTQAGLRWRNVIGQKDLYVYPSNTGRVAEIILGISGTRASSLPRSGAKTCSPETTYWPSGSGR